MRFWTKIGFLTAVTYFVCNASFLIQDRRDRHQVLHEVEVQTQITFREVQAGRCSEETLCRLDVARQNLAVSDARWERDASHLLLLPPP